MSAEQKAAKILNSIFSEKDSFEFLDKLLQAIDAGDPEALSSQPESVKMAVVIFWFLIEVDNGGIDQYLSNSSGNSFETLLSSLEKVGSEKTLTLMREIKDFFPEKSVPSDREIRNDLMENRIGLEGKKKIEANTDRYHQSSEDVADLLRKYLLPRKTEFLPFLSWLK
jgi:Domain of unknown function (DUF4375)